MKNTQKYLEANKEFWNKRVGIHVSSSFYDVDSFRAGKSSLNEIEIQALGSLENKSLLHLQCHFGMDTISLAREGARVTGVDFSGEAISKAKELSAGLGTDARFICCDVYELPLHLDEQFDIVFTSYGVIGWLPDLDKWAAVINRFLKPGGMFFMAEFHPFVWMMDENFTGITYSYFNSGVIETVSQGSYADRDAPLAAVEYGWNHSFDEVFNSLMNQGLPITSFKEYNYSPYDCFNNCVKGDDGFYRIKGLENKLPMMYTLKSIKSM